MKLVIDCDLANYNVDSQKHFNVDIHPSNISVKVGEPDKLRPSGFGNVANILRNLGRNAGTDRQIDGCFHKMTAQYIMLP